MTGIEIRGAEQLAALTRRLKEAADKELQKELRKGIKLALDPLRKELPKSARDILPKKGGLAEKVAKSKYSISRKNTSRESGLRLVAKNEYSLFKMDQGELKHPIPRRNPRKPKKWVKQRIRLGWASGPFDEKVPQARVEIEQAMNRIIAHIDGRDTPSA